MTYEGQNIEVRGGAWNLAENSSMYTVIDSVGGHLICRMKDDGTLFALEV